MSYNPNPLETRVATCFEPYGSLFPQYHIKSARRWMIMTPFAASQFAHSSSQPREFPKLNRIFVLARHAYSHSASEGRRKVPCPKRLNLSKKPPGSVTSSQ